MKRINIFKVIMTIIIFIIIILLAVFIIKAFHKNKEVDIDNISKQVEHTEKYNLKIFYDKTNIAELDKKVSSFIEEEEEKFIKNIKRKNIDEHKYDFILDAHTAEYNDLEFVNIYLYSYTGGMHYEKEINTFVYDKTNKKFLSIKDFLIPEVFENFSIKTRELIYEHAKENNMELDEEMVNEGTLPKPENFKNFYINDIGLTFIFEPYQIATWADGELAITMPWEIANEFLKEEYRNNNKVAENTKVIKPKKRDLKIFKDKKIIAFTFDDGPNTKTTSILLDKLPELDARVTFFVVGNRVSYNTEVLKRAYEEGNEIGSHSYSHRNFLKLDDDAILEEINNTNKAINEVIGVNPIYLRPPYGNTNEHIKSLAMLHTICWNVDSLDWKLKDREKIKEEILKNSHDGAVVLLHDIYEESVEGAILAMQELKEQGYAFVTISELIELKEKSLDDYTLTFYGFKENN